MTRPFKNNWGAILPGRYFLSVIEAWKKAWAFRNFRQKIIIGAFFNVITLSSLPSFFNYIERRNGIVLNDFLINQIPSIDVSGFLVFFIAISIGMFTIKAIGDPMVVVLFLFSYSFLTIARIATIYFVPLNPPPHLIRLNDSLSNLLYYGGFKTKDLFFSGHVSLVSLFGICLIKRSDKILMAFNAIMVGTLVLIQHIHYTIDVAIAPIFAYVCYYAAKKIKS